MITLQNIKPISTQDNQKEFIHLKDETMIERKNKVLKKMRENEIDTLVIYGDLEHGSNFEYLTGILTRFEEGLLILHKSGESYLLLGNENLGKVSYSRIKSKAIHVPFFSLPNQPMLDDTTIVNYLKEAQIKPNTKVGLVGWKMFTSKVLNNSQLYDIPYYIVDAIKEIVGFDHMCNCCSMFIGPDGVRTTNNPNEIAHYEFASVLASDGMMDALNHVEVGIKEMELGEYMSKCGQRNSVVTIASTGERLVIYIQLIILLK